MKKILYALLIYFSGTIISCCSDDGTYTYITVETANALLFSFDENGTYPYFDDFNPNELGIGVYADSLTSRMEMSSIFSSTDKLYACDDPDETYYTNTIDSLNIYTIYDFDENHPSGSNINDILMGISSGQTYEINVNEVSSLYHHFKFSAIPENDSLRFKITGRITEKGSFTQMTELIILD